MGSLSDWLQRQEILEDQQNWDPDTLQHHLPAWTSMLRDDPDCVWILQVIRHGYSLRGNAANLRPAWQRNYSSVRDNPQEALRIIQREVKAGRIQVAPRATRTVALGLVPKSGADRFRMIYDFSRPLGNALNETLPDMPFHFATLDQAFQLMTPGGYMALVDIRHAYRHIPIAKEDWTLQGLHLQGVTYLDHFLTFGMKTSPAIFSRFTRAVARHLRRAGITVVVYLDEILILEPTCARCTQSLRTTIVCLRCLGFYITWPKLRQPSQLCEFLGILLDSKLMEARLSPERLQILLTLLLSIRARRRITIKELATINGKLAWAAKVVFAGRTFHRRLINAHTRAKAAHRYWINVRGPIRRDLQWWIAFLPLWNGKALLHHQLPVTALEVQTNASGLAAGARWGNQGIAYIFPPSQSSWHINVKETFAVLLLLLHWRPLIRNRTIQVGVDSTVAMAWVNTGTARAAEAMPILREIYWILAVENARLRAQWLPSDQNVVADALSRLQFHLLPTDFHAVMILEPPPSGSPWPLN